jgi:hypothetical protein
MKKKSMIIITIVILILIALVSVFIYNKVIESGKNYEIEQVSQYNYFILKQDDLYGVIDKNGNSIIATEYSEIKIPNPEKAVFVCYKGESTKILNENGEEILSQYNDIEPIRLKNITSELMYEKSVLKYAKDGKYGLINFEGKEITKPIYDEIDSLSYKEGELLVKQNDKYGVINIKGNKIVEIEYDTIAVDEYYTDENHYKYAGYIVSVTTQEGYRYGYLNNKGKEVLKTEYNDIERVTEIEDNANSYLICAKNGQYGITKNSEQIVENEYQSIRYDNTNNVFVIEKSKKYGIANIDGQLIVPVEYNQIDITGIYLYAQNEQGTTVYNNSGTQVNIDSNVAILNTSNEKYKIRINNENGTKYGVINKEGKQLIEENYNYIEYLYDNYFIVSNENGKLGILDDKETEKIEINKDSLQKIQDTELIQTTLTESKTTQIYSNTMEKICEMNNANVEVMDDYIKVYNETDVKYFSKDGKELKNTEVYSNNKLFVKVENEQYGFVDANGNVVVDYKYDKAYEFNQYGFAAVKKDGKWGAINEQGQEVIAPTYEFKEQIEPSFIGRYYRVTYGFGEFYYTDAK